MPGWAQFSISQKSAIVKGETKQEKLVSAINLQVPPAASCKNLQFAAVFCHNLRFQSPLISRAGRMGEHQSIAQKGVHAIDPKNRG